MSNEDYYYRKAKNQYNKNNEDKYSIYMWLMRNCKEVYDLATNKICCLVPYKNTRGIDFCYTKNGHPAHIRFSYNGRKVIASEFVKNFVEGLNDAPTNLVCSHRCHNPFCLNVDHIVYEAQDDYTNNITNNIGRIGCLGHVVLVNIDDDCIEGVVKVCTHHPCCLKTCVRIYEPFISWLEFEKNIK
jgi:hypothetical protein